ncbi:MAG: hypothetical protein ABIH76_08770 [Candidatus Bathyarchaeota archaeon]
MSDTIIIVIVCLFVFLIARELVCWYWKLNKIVSLLESIDEKLDLDDRIEQIQIALDKIESNSVAKANGTKTAPSLDK